MRRADPSHPREMASLMRMRPLQAAARPARAAARVVCSAAAPAAPKQKGSPSPLTTAPPSTYAIIEVGGSQLFVEPGRWYTVNRLKADVGSQIKFGRVLALKHEDKLTVGMPYLDKVVVEAEVIEELRGPKVIVYKMKPKKHYRCAARNAAARGQLAGRGGG
jgi:large subunit ribosomal protein L21